MCRSSPTRDGGIVCSGVLLDTETSRDSGGFVRKRRTLGGTWLVSHMGEMDEVETT